MSRTLSLIGAVSALALATPAFAQIAAAAPPGDRRPASRPAGPAGVC